MLKIKGTKVIITGGSTELGYAICKVLGQAGASLALVDNDEIKGKEVSEELAAKGIECQFYIADITKGKEIRKVVDTVLHNWGQVDVLVNSGGETSGGFITDITEEEWDNMIDLHLKSTFLACQAVLPHMISQGKGKIVNIASVEAKQGFPYAGIHYSAAKGGIMSLTRQLALQVSPCGIHVNCVAPGPIKNELRLSRLFDNQDDFLTKIPLGRLARPEDTAYAVLFLASPMAEFLTGETIDINGGKFLA